MIAGSHVELHGKQNEHDQRKLEAALEPMDARK